MSQNFNDIFGGIDEWSFEQVISPGRSHKVLFHWPLRENELPQPQRALAIAWDHDNVRLPNSPENQYSEIDEEGKTSSKHRWNLIKEVFSQPILTSRDLENAIKAYNSRYKDIWNFASLHDLFDNQLSTQRITDFFDKILPEIIRIALQLPDIIQCPIPLLKQGSNKSLSMSQQQIACLLANGFLCTFPRRNTDKRNSEYANYPTINFNKLFSAQGQNVIEKLKCVCNYFYRVLCVKMPMNVVTFQRRSMDVKIKWEQSAVKLSSIKCKVTQDGKIETGNGMLQVDFANRFVGGGVLGHGCVQEEIRFVINPEMIVARLFTESLCDEEALLMIGCEQYNFYRGYASNFQWVSSFNDQTPLDSSRRKKCRIVAIDALNYKNNYDQFREQTFRRELNKAFVGFYDERGSDRTPIASGLWGCGAFNGNPIRSALIQLMACAENHRNIVLFTFGDDQARSEIYDIFNFLSEKKTSVGELYRLVKKYRFDGNPDNPSELALFIKMQYESMNPYLPFSQRKLKEETIIDLSSAASNYEELESINVDMEVENSMMATGDEPNSRGFEETFSSYKKSSIESASSSSSQVKDKPIKRMSLIDHLDFDMKAIQCPKPKSDDPFSKFSKN